MPGKRKEKQGPTSKEKVSQADRLFGDDGGSSTESDGRDPEQIDIGSFHSDDEKELR